MDTELDRFDPATPFDAEGSAHDAARDLACLRIGIVNVYLAGAAGAGDREWVLIDAGLPGSAGRIRRAAEARFGPGARPSAIVLTHGHFDHVGALETLATEWDCPVYAHSLELPYLNGHSAYPPFDPTVGGGAMARLAPLYPRDPLYLGERVRTLPANGSVPGMPGWRWLHTPGHTPGHVSLFREEDRVLVAGDAVVTTKQESMIAALTQRVEIHGPPAYATPDWRAAHRSAQAIAALEPRVLASGHGRVLAGDAVAEGLALLARDFWSLAVPEQGRYVNEPARFDTDGVVSVPPPVRDDFMIVAGAAALAAVAGVATWALLRHRERAPTRASLENESLDSGSLEGESFDLGIEIEAALLAGDETTPVGSAFESELIVPIARDDGESRPGYGTRWGERHRIQPPSLEAER